MGKSRTFQRKRAMEKELVFSVSEFNAQVNLILVEHLPKVAVEGEISELRAAGGNTFLFLTLKDEKAELKVFAFTARLTEWSFLEEGMTVRVYGHPELYKPRGRFNLHAEEILPVGEGSLRLAFEKLKKKLGEEGLFAPERKRCLPLFPETIGLLTAPNSRAFSDFTKVLKNRMGGLKIFFFPIPVQGIKAPSQIRKAINWFAHRKTRIDLLVITRGGGSLEDLAAFNTEEVVRAVYGCPLPVVSAVGHEADVSLVDLAADLRASTPSNAAELIVRDRNELINQVDNLSWRAYQALKLKVSTDERRIIQALRLAEGFFQDQWRLVTKVEERTKSLEIRLARLVADYTNQVGMSWQQISQQLLGRVNQFSTTIVGLWRLAESFNPRLVLARGYSVTRKQDGQILKSSLEIEVGEKMVTDLSRGKIDSVVKRVEPQRR
jgi:exodeoxyribonuclease VII large subunit